MVMTTVMAMTIIAAAVVTAIGCLRACGGNGCMMAGLCGWSLAGGVCCAVAAVRSACGCHSLWLSLAVFIATTTYADIVIVLPRPPDAPWPPARPDRSPGGQTCRPGDGRDHEVLTHLPVQGSVRTLASSGAQLPQRSPDSAHRARMWRSQLRPKRREFPLGVDQRGVLLRWQRLALFFSLGQVPNSPHARIL